MISTRESYGKALEELGEKYPNIVVLDADLSTATMTKYFAKKYPDRFLDMGISEADMIGTAAGLSTCGKIPFASTFAVFAAGRAYDQIRTSVCYPKNNVKIVGSHSGITVGEDGATHQMLEDVNLMRGFPNMNIIAPCDDISTRWAVEEAIKIHGPVYIRTSRPKVDSVYTEGETFEFGKGKVHGDGKDVAIFTYGITTLEAIKAMKILEEKNIHARVIDLITLKPVDKNLIVETAKEVDNIVTVEDHSIIGGIGTIVSEVLCEIYPKEIYRIGIKDEFGHSGKWDELMKEYFLDSEGIVKEICMRYY